MIRKSILMLTIASALTATATLANAAVLQSTGEQVIAREAAEGPRGADNERPGDRQRRGGKAFDDSFQIARETTEGPRGADNERPGDRQRRGGRLFAGVVVTV